MVDEKQLAEEAQKQAKLQGLSPDDTRKYIRDYVTESLRINNRFNKEVARMELNPTEEEVFRSLLTTTPNNKPDGTPKTEEEMWAEVTTKMENLVKSRKPTEDEEPVEPQEVDLTKKETPKPAGDLEGRKRKIDIDEADDTETEEDYPLADDDKYFKWREETYRKLKTLKKTNQYDK